MKSRISDYLEVAQAIYKDACVKCAAEVSYRDLKTIRSRVKTQGISFLTITLPNFCSDFERSLELGFVDPSFFQNFRKNGAIPAFLQGLLGLVFNQETGRINDVDSTFQSSRSPDFIANLVSSIRQICLAFKKVKLPCTAERQFKALESFIENERSFNVFPLPREDDERFNSVSSLLWDRFVHTISVNELVPRHGPGQTAEKRSGNRKFRWQFWHHRLEPYFPLIDSAYSASAGELDFSSEELKFVTMVHPDDEQPARVALVPKTLKGPRIIAIEPCCMQYAQQAISTRLCAMLESYRFTRGHINFRDQSINGKLAMSSSFDRQYASIDLSDASDRVPVGYALGMFRGNPDLKDFIEACRSRRASLPDGRIVHLRKFASMGSALCFPIEAMYFYTICVVALLRFHNLPVTRENIFFVSRDIHVYGDDIIVPTVAAATVLDHLRKYNCKVNDRKTFYRGYFRESCGVDAYLGRSVTPIYVNRGRPKDRQQVKEILSWLAAANHFSKRGYLRTSSVLFSGVEKVLGTLPGVPDDSPILGRNRSWCYDPPKRWNRRFQRIEVLCWIQSPVYREDKLDGYAALQKCLMKLTGLQDLNASRDFLHLERSALHGEVAINRRWVPASLMSGYRQ